MSTPADTTKQSTTLLANEAWEALLSAHTTLMKRFVSDDIWGDLSIREYDVLYTLSKCLEPIRLSELQRHVLLSQPALSRMCDRLVARGLVRRDTDPADARGVLLSLTRDGLGTQRRVGRGHARSVTRAMTTSLSHGELVELRDICQSLADHSREPVEGQRP